MLKLYKVHSGRGRRRGRKKGRAAQELALCSNSDTVSLQPGDQGKGAGLVESWFLDTYKEAIAVNTSYSLFFFFFNL